MDHLSLQLLPGDDVKYHVIGSPAQLLGRVAHVNASSFRIQRFILSSAYTVDDDHDDSEDDDDFSTDSFLRPRRGLVEVILTNEVDDVPQLNIDGIIFVLSTKYLRSDPISFVGMDDVYYLKFIIHPENYKVKIDDWQSFRKYGYPHEIFQGLVAVRAVMSKALNRTLIISTVYWTTIITNAALPYCPIHYSFIYICMYT